MLWACESNLAARWAHESNFSLKRNRKALRSSHHSRHHKRAIMTNLRQKLLKSVQSEKLALKPFWNAKIAANTYECCAQFNRTLIWWIRQCKKVRDMQSQISSPTSTICKTDQCIVPQNLTRVRVNPPNSRSTGLSQSRGSNRVLAWLSTKNWLTAVNRLHSQGMYCFTRWSQQPSPRRYPCCLYVICRSSPWIASALGTESMIYASRSSYSRRGRKLWCLRPAALSNSRSPTDRRRTELTRTAT